MRQPGQTPPVAATVSAPEATFGLTDRDGPGPEDLGLDQVTAHGWRVTDDRLPPRDPFRVLGFIEYRADLFEVMQIGGGFEWHTFATLQDALAHIVSTATELAQQRIGALSLDSKAPDRVRALR